MWGWRKGGLEVAVKNKAVVKLDDILVIIIPEFPLYLAGILRTFLNLFHIGLNVIVGIVLSIIYQLFTNDP